MGEDLIAIDLQLRVVPGLWLFVVEMGLSWDRNSLSTTLKDLIVSGEVDLILDFPMDFGFN